MKVEGKNINTFITLEQQGSQAPYRLAESILCTYQNIFTSNKKTYYDH